MYEGKLALKSTFKVLFVTAYGLPELRLTGSLHVRVCSHCVSALLRSTDIAQPNRADISTPETQNQAEISDTRDTLPNVAEISDTRDTLPNLAKVSYPRDYLS